MDQKRDVQARQLLKKAKRIVVKVGSAALTSGNSMNLSVIDNLARELSALQDEGKEVVLVSSGAVAAGRKRLGIHDTQDISLQDKQALAAIGQSHLMHIYDEAFGKYGKNIAQLLLTHADLSHRKRYLNFKNTLFTLLKMGVIPILNENDTVSTEELRFGDNDNLGALVTNLIEGDLFICLTVVDRLYTANPESDASARPLYVVESISDEIEQMAHDGKSSLGTGGMQTKITAVRKVAAGGGASVIASGRQAGILHSILAGENVGTLFLPQRKRLQGRKQWIAFVLKPQGRLFLDEGACEAILSSGKSLLASGLSGLEGSFCAGDAVTCVNGNGEVIAVGLIRYSADELERILGATSNKIKDILGITTKSEVIHRDDLVLL